MTTIVPEITTPELVANRDYDLVTAYSRGPAIIATYLGPIQFRRKTMEVFRQKNKNCAYLIKDPEEVRNDEELGNGNPYIVAAGLNVWHEDGTVHTKDVVEANERFFHTGSLDFSLQERSELLKMLGASQ